MPVDEFGDKYESRGWILNSKGNEYETRDYGPDAPNQNAYAYRNQDGSFFASCRDNSTFYSTTRFGGFTKVTNANGESWVEIKGVRYIESSEVVQPISEAKR